MKLKENSVGYKPDSKMAREVDIEGNEKLVLSSF